MASFKVNVAVPEDAGRGAPCEVVGVVGGFSAALVRVALKRKQVVWASTPATGPSTPVPRTLSTSRRRRNR
jgi:hypothetical protein